MFAPVSGSPASSSQKIVWRYSSSAAVACSRDIECDRNRRAPPLLHREEKLLRREVRSDGRVVPNASGEPYREALAGVPRGTHRRRHRGAEALGEVHREAEGVSGVGALI